MDHFTSRRQLLPNVRLGAGRNSNGFGSARTVVLGLVRIIFASLPVTSVSANPIPYSRRGVSASLEREDGGDREPKSDLWVLYLVSAVLVLLGGAFAGLTIA